MQDLKLREKITPLKTAQPPSSSKNNGPSLKALANEDTLLPTQMFPCLPARATFVADTNFVSATNVSQFAQHGNTTFILCSARLQAPKKHHEQQCVHNNVSSFARASKVTFSPNAPLKGSRRCA